MFLHHTSIPYLIDLSTIMHSFLHHMSSTSAPYFIQLSSIIHSFFHHMSSKCPPYMCTILHPSVRYHAFTCSPYVHSLVSIYPPYISHVSTILHPPFHYHEFISSPYVIHMSTPHHTSATSPPPSPSSRIITIVTIFHQTSLPYFGPLTFLHHSLSSAPSCCLCPPLHHTLHTFIQLSIIISILYSGNISLA